MTSSARTRALAVLLSLAVPVGIGATASSATAGTDTFHTVVGESHARLQACKSRSGGTWTVDLRVVNRGRKTVDAEVYTVHGRKTTDAWKSGPVKPGSTSRTGSVQLPVGKPGYQLSFTLDLQSSSGFSGSGENASIDSIKHC